jgi:hypothetical protein
VERIFECQVLYLRKTIGDGKIPKCRFHTIRVYLKSIEKLYDIIKPFVERNVFDDFQMF